MSPHRLTTVRRYKIANDILILILGYLDPPSLWRAAQAFERIFSLVIEYTPLLYIYELAETGMKDGPAPHSYRSPAARLQLLLSYKKAFQNLYWMHEFKQLIPAHARTGVSGGFLHQIRIHATQYTIELAELPSMRAGIAPSHTRHLKFNTPEIENVAIDRAQSLIVTSHLVRVQGGIGAILYFRDLWTFGKHPRAHGGLYDFSAGSNEVANMSMAICGHKMSISFEFAGGKMRHLILNWRKFQAMWLDDNDVHFLTENYLLVFRRTYGRPMLAVYNITDLGEIIVEREYELPDSWSTSIIGFSPNTSPLTDRACSAESIFYSDPSHRVLLLVVQSPSKPGAPPLRNWLIINESYFRIPVRQDHLRVPWAHWNQYCLVRDVSPMVQDPHVVGSKVVFLDAARKRDPSGQIIPCSFSRLNIIHFPPFPDQKMAPLSHAWSWIGDRTHLVPVEVAREVPQKTIEGRQVEHIRVTEDNIVLFLENQENGRPVNILTFGPTQTTRSRV